MIVNFSGMEYDQILAVAHSQGRKPAEMVHEWVIETLCTEYLVLVSRPQQGTASRHSNEDDDDAMPEMPSDAEH